jgi:diguanylate cyclase (GGDEF)-like protein
MSLLTRRAAAALYQRLVPRSLSARVLTFLAALLAVMQSAIWLWAGHEAGTGRNAAALAHELLVVELAALAVFLVAAFAAMRHLFKPLAPLTKEIERMAVSGPPNPDEFLEPPADPAAISCALSAWDRRDELGALAQAVETLHTRFTQERWQMRERAWRDALTHLPNRLQFREVLEARLVEARHHGREVRLAVLMLGLDRFKHVNETLGYRLGDLVLMHFGDRLSRQTVRRGDLVARVGSDEFAVLLHDADVELADAVARRLAASFEKPLAFEGQHIEVRASIGVACYPQHATGADSLLERAQAALGAAKRRRHSPMLYNSAIDTGSSHTLSLLAELRHAIDAGELRLYLQPKIALAGARLVGAEALLRWQHPVRGLVMPLQFIPFAEQTGIVRPLTLWVLEECARIWLQLYDHGLRLTLALNISMHDLLDADLPAKFDAVLARMRVPAEAFCLEIAERALMGDPARAIHALERLGALGFRLAIDDFGTAWSSVPYLKRLPVDELKIDHTLVRQVETDVDDASVVRAAAGLAHQLGLTVVAEGVETGSTYGMLKALGFHEAQGNHLGKPIPEHEFAAWAASWNARQTSEHGSLEAGRVLH